MESWEGWVGRDLRDLLDPPPCHGQGQMSHFTSIFCPNLQYLGSPLSESPSKFWETLNINGGRSLFLRPRAPVAAGAAASLPSQGVSGWKG